MEETMNLTEGQIQKVIETFQEVLEIVNKIYDSIRKIVEQSWKEIKEFLLKNEKVNKYLKIYNRTHNNRIKKKQITKLVELFENYKK